MKKFFLTLLRAMILKLESYIREQQIVYKGPNFTVMEGQRVRVAYAEPRALTKQRAIEAWYRVDDEARQARFQSDMARYTAEERLRWSFRR